MQSLRPMTKLFLYISIFTGACWAIALTCFSFSGDKTFPDDVLVKLETKLNTQLETISDTHVVPSQGIRRVRIEAGSTDVVLTTVQAPDVTSELKGHSVVGTKTEVTLSDGELLIKVVKPKHWRLEFTPSSSFNSDASLRLKVALPSTFRGDLKVEAGSGDVTGSALAIGNIEVEAGSGEIDLTNVESKELTLQSGSGDMKLSGKVETLTVETGSGSVSVPNISGNRLTFRTGSGEITIDEVKSKLSKFSSGSGDIKIHLRDLNQWTATAESGSGIIKGDFPGMVRSNNDHHVRVGKGENQMEVETGSGDIHLAL